MRRSKSYSGELHNILAIGLLGNLSCIYTTLMNKFQTFLCYSLCNIIADYYELILFQVILQHNFLIIYESTFVLGWQNIVINVFAQK